MPCHCLRGISVSWHGGMHRMTTIRYEDVKCFGFISWINNHSLLGREIESISYWFFVTSFLFVFHHVSLESLGFFLEDICNYRTPNKLMYFILFAFISELVIKFPFKMHHKSLSIIAFTFLQICKTKIQDMLAI